MKKARWELEEEIERLTRLTNGKAQRKIITKLFTEHGIPVSTTSDILSLRRSPKDEDLFILYHIYKELDHKRVGQFFDAKEIETYEQKKVDTNRAEFPLVYKVIEVDKDQWLGKISMKELVALGNAQLINYNENAQRVLKRIVKGNEESYRIQLNKAAVKAIEESLLLNRYIPNTITLNIPQDDKSKFWYEEKTQELIIQDIAMFDILDGYHRYVAMSSLAIQNDKIDQIFELRIANFSDEKARQFIWQEDQKTKMRKVDSNAMNKYNVGNQVVSKLKDSSVGNLIGRNEVIDEAVLGQGINLVFLRQKNYTNSEIVKVANLIKNGFSALESEFPDIFDDIVEPNRLYCMLVAFYYEEDNANVINEFIKDMIADKQVANHRELSVSDVRRLKNNFKERRDTYV